jgi:hypothetical protein
LPNETGLGLRVPDGATTVNATVLVGPLGVDALMFLVVSPAPAEIVKVAVI